MNMIEMTRRTAYLLGFVSLETGRIKSVGIFSERYPTQCDEPWVTVELMQTAASSYQEARDHLWSICEKADAYWWGSHIARRMREYVADGM